MITAKHRGGGNKRLYRIIDFKRQQQGLAWPPTLQSIEYDPNRSCNIALIQVRPTAQKMYILAPNGYLKVGMKVISGPDRVEPDLGNCMPAGEHSDVVWKSTTSK